MSLPWMPSLTPEGRERLKKLLEATIPSELATRRWGAKAPHRSIKNAYYYYITDYRALNLVSGIIRYALKDSTCKVFYRGQNFDWDVVPSLYRKIKSKSDIQIADNWVLSIIDCIKDTFDPLGTVDEREALAQHYGLHTRWLDVVDHIQTALWFACDSIEQDEASLGVYGDVGYIKILAIPEGWHDLKIMDLRTKPSQWLRPHVQQAFCVRQSSPPKYLGSMQQFLVMTLVIPKTLLLIWSNYENIPHHFMYPRESVDQGQQYWKNALNQINSMGLEFNKY